MRQVLVHLPEYPSLTAAAEAVARREGLGKETVRRWAVQAQIDGGQRLWATSLGRVCQISGVTGPGSTGTAARSGDRSG